MQCFVVSWLRKKAKAWSSTRSFWCLSLLLLSVFCRCSAARSAQSSTFKWSKCLVQLDKAFLVSGARVFLPRLGDHLLHHVERDVHELKRAGLLGPNCRYIYTRCSH